MCGGLREELWQPFQSRFKTLCFVMIGKWGQNSKLVRLSTMLNLKNLYISTTKAGFYSHRDTRMFMLRDNALIRSLIKDLPKLVINNGKFGTASPFTSINSSNELWEIRCEKLDYFMEKSEHMEGLGFDNDWWNTNEYYESLTGY